MIFLLTLFLFYTLGNCQVLPNRPVTQVPAINVSPTSLYPGFNRNQWQNGYNPYYNSQGAAVPIVSYSDNRGIDGSYSYRYVIQSLLYFTIMLVYSYGLKSCMTNVDVSFFSYKGMICVSPLFDIKQ